MASAALNLDTRLSESRRETESHVGDETRLWNAPRPKQTPTFLAFHVNAGQTGREDAATSRVSPMCKHTKQRRTKLKSQLASFVLPSSVRFLARAWNATAGHRAVHYYSNYSLFWYTRCPRPPMAFPSDPVSPLDILGLAYRARLSLIRE